MGRVLFSPIQISFSVSSIATLRFLRTISLIDYVSHLPTLLIFWSAGSFSSDSTFPSRTPACTAGWRSLYSPSLLSISGQTTCRSPLVGGEYSAYQNSFRRGDLGKIQVKLVVERHVDSISQIWLRLARSACHADLRLSFIRISIIIPGNLTISCTRDRFVVLYPLSRRWMKCIKISGKERFKSWTDKRWRRKSTSVSFLVQIFNPSSTELGYTPRWWKYCIRVRTTLEKSAVPVLDLLNILKFDQLQRSNLRKRARSGIHTFPSQLQDPSMCEKKVKQ